MKLGGTLVELYQQYTLKTHLQLQGMEDLVYLVNDQIENNTLLEAVKEKILAKDSLYQQMLRQATIVLEQGIDIGESYKTMLEIREKYALLHPDYQLINQLINNQDELLGDCGCNN